MPSPSYSLVKDEQDSRVPVHTDEEFFNGICFQAKVSSKNSLKMLKKCYKYINYHMFFYSQGL